MAKISPRSSWTPKYASMEIYQEIYQSNIYYFVLFDYVCHVSCILSSHKVNHIFNFNENFYLLSSELSLLAPILSWRSYLFYWAFIIQMNWMLIFLIYPEFFIWLKSIIIPVDSFISSSFTLPSLVIDSRRLGGIPLTRTVEQFFTTS